jgi:Transposase zinc-ribbon domain/ISXO2-like transposase domain
MFKEFKSLPALFDYFKTEDVCFEYLVKMRWPDGVHCPFCDCEKVYNTKRKKSNGTTVSGFKCGNSKCYKKFSVTTGTYLEATKIELRLWIAALYLCASNKKGVSSVQMAKYLNCSQKTAWFLIHRIRGTMKVENPSALSGIVEVDETYVGPKDTNQGRSTKKKTPVLGMVERG